MEVFTRPPSSKVYENETKTNRSSGRLPVLLKRKNNKVGTCSKRNFLALVIVF